jgi:hypothetical protein
MWSLFWPGDLVLTIGVPLAAGLSLRSFTGVLAHEFGHFAQGLGMRFSYVIHSVNYWFARVVYQRDSWDEWLDEQTESEEGWVSLIAHIARLFVFLTRGILWLLMVLGHMISCGMARQMEFDADLHEIRTSGSANFETTSRRMTALSVAEAAVYNELRASWRDGKLADNLPILIVVKADEIAPEVQAKIDTGVDKGKTGWFDTHPSDAARIRRARKVDDPGVFCVGGAATQLFADFAGLSKSITLSHYRDLIGPEVTPKNLISTVDVTRRRDDARRCRDAADRFYFGCVSLRRPILLDGHSANFKLDEATARKKLAGARQGLKRHAKAIRDRHQRFRKSDNRLVELAVLETVIKAGKKVDAEKCGLSESTTQAVAAARIAAERDRRVVVDELIKIEEVLRTRTETALRMLSADSIAKRVRGIERLQRRTRDLLGSLSAVAGVSGTLGKLRQGMPGMQALAQILSDGGQDEERIRQALRLTESQHTHLTALRSMLVPIQYPFAHASGRIALSQYALAHLPERDDFGGVYAAADDALEAMDALYVRLLGEIAQICEAVEAAAGFAPTKVASAAPAAKPEAA